MLGCFSPLLQKPLVCKMGLLRNSDSILTFSLLVFLHIPFQLDQRTCSLSVRTTGKPGLCTLMTSDAEPFGGSFPMENPVHCELLFSFETQRMKARLFLY